MSVEVREGRSGYITDKLIAPINAETAGWNGSPGALVKPRTAAAGHTGVRVRVAPFIPVRR